MIRRPNGRTRHRPALLLGLTLLACPAIAMAAHHRHARTPGAGPVILTQQPGSALDQAARRLNAEDLAGAARHNEQPVVLIGSAPLSLHHGDAALFVQTQSASLCGSAGCSTSVYLRQGSDWTKVLDSVSGPIKVSSASHQGMHDLVVGDRDRWIWDGSAYQDTLPAAPIGNLRRSVERHQERVKDAAAAAAPSSAPSH